MKDYTGQKFNRLTAVRFSHLQTFPCGKRQQVWEFTCVCGKSTKALINLVKRGHTRSCGCYQAERKIQAHLKHGDNRQCFKHPLYIVWSGIKQRCEEVGYRRYADWGGRGIKVLWESYEHFKADMLPTYKPGLQIERKDNDGHYCKENCTWATRKEQCLNKRNKRILTLNGVSMNLSLWTEKLGWPRGRIEGRLKLGWSVEEALTTPSQRSIAV